MFWVNHRKTEVDQLEQTIHDIETSVLNDKKSINDFFTYDTKNPDYFKTRKSNYLEKHKQYSVRIKSLTQSLGFEKENGRIDVENRLQVFGQLTDTLNRYINRISVLIYERGFKDDGIEGEMRNYAHDLESIQQLNLSELLMLRRHEKDYIIRNEQRYINQFNQRLTDFEKSVQTSSYTTKQKKKILADLSEYRRCFNHMVELDREIGIKDNTALKAQIESVSDELLHQSNRLEVQCNQYKATIYDQLKVISLAVLIFLIVFGILMSIQLSGMMTKRITLLSEFISKFVQSSFTFNEPVPVKLKDDEISQLISNFEFLRQSIIGQIQHLEVKVAERTEEINIQKEQILVQNNKLLDSLKYALNIQEALLPGREFMNKTLPEHFVLFKPKDLVSGDFYWFKHINNHEFNISILVVADCTGHGVPGAFMSMLGIAFLNEIVIRKDVRTAADILNQLRDKVLDNLVQQNNGKVISDGMDVAVVILNHRKQTMQFAGAFRPLIMIRNNELIKFNGNKMPIGRYTKEFKPFTYTEFPVQKNDMFYVFTDGFADQFGEATNQKYLMKTMKKLLLSIHDLPMENQQNLLARVFSQWQGNCEQTDDVLLVGFRP